MRTVNRLLIGVLCSVALQANDYIKVPIKGSVAEATSYIKGEIAQKKALQLFTIVNHKANARNVGMKMPASQLIIFGNPKAGTKLMKLDPTIAVELPLKLLIYRENGATYALYKKPSFYPEHFALKKAPIEAKLEKLYAMLLKGLKK